MPPRRSFGLVANESALEDDDSPGIGERPQARRVLGRVSFGQNNHRPSFTARWRNNQDAESGRLSSPVGDRPPIPSALQSSGETYSTPLPLLPMIVLSITMLGEFLSANVSTPFLLFMVKGFGETHDEADVAFWTGVIVAAFFMTQFITSLLWATVAEKHGRRAVLCISLFGSAVTCLIFGTCTTLYQAIAVRLLQGIFAGAVGVARGSVAFVTDSSNEGRAYAILGFCWGFGGVAGAIIGGAFETPAAKWPRIFDNIPMFVNYPYLLPCGLAASITFTGSVLACFLGRDGGPREGAIRLPEKIDTHRDVIVEEEELVSSPFAEEPESHGIVGALRRKVSKKLSGYLSQPVPIAHARSNSTFSMTESPTPLTSSPRGDRLRTFSRTSRADGSAYGYSGGYRSRLASTVTMGTRKGSMSSSLRRRRGSNANGPQAGEGGELNFAQRLLMANENAVTNIADLWVAAAMNVDNEDPFQSDEEELVSEPDSVEGGLDEHVGEEGAAPSTPTHRARLPSIADSNSTAARKPPSNRRPSRTLLSPTTGSRRPSGSLQDPSTPVRHMSASQAQDSPRRYSSTVPAIFSHAGVRTPPAVIDAQQLLVRSEDSPRGETLSPILETHPTTNAEHALDTEKAPSLTSQLPIMIIAQYGFLALHSTTHDQIFMSYLVSDYDAGGLNLNAGHFAQLIALMCLAQIAYQFYFYPNIGPPRGRFSHLAMFRIGSTLFIPSYFTVILYRAFASSEDDGNFVVMTALALSTALRYCAITFAYTAISILLNYMTPPNAVGIANGIAQSIVSLARCFGPVLGGYLWSVSVQDNPSGYPLGFVVVACACALAVVQSFMIR